MSIPAPLRLGSARIILRKMTKNPYQEKHSWLWAFSRNFVKEAFPDEFLEGKKDIFIILEQNICLYDKTDNRNNENINTVQIGWGIERLNEVQEDSGRVPVAAQLV